jgi:hypothetical protein
MIYSAVGDASANLKESVLCVSELNVLFSITPEPTMNGIPLNDLTLSRSDGYGEVFDIPEVFVLKLEFVLPSERSVKLIAHGKGSPRFRIYTSFVQVSTIHFAGSETDTS